MVVCGTCRLEILFVKLASALYVSQLVVAPGKEASRKQRVVVVPERPEEPGALFLKLPCARPISFVCGAEEQQGFGRAPRIVERAIDRKRFLRPTASLSQHLPIGYAVMVNSLALLSTRQRAGPWSPSFLHQARKRLPRLVWIQQPSAPFQQLSSRRNSSAKMTAERVALTCASGFLPSRS